jgi:hypothetical protein
MSSQRGIAQPRQLLQRGLQVVAFWGAILVPLAYLPLLYRLDSVGSYRLLIGLVLVNLCCLVIDQMEMLEPVGTNHDL